MSDLCHLGPGFDITSANDGARTIGRHVRRCAEAGSTTRRRGFVAGVDLQPCRSVRTGGVCTALRAASTPLTPTTSVPVIVPRSQSIGSTL